MPVQLSTQSVWMTSVLNRCDKNSKMTDSKISAAKSYCKTLYHNVSWVTPQSRIVRIRSSHKAGS